MGRSTRSSKPSPREREELRIRSMNQAYCDGVITGLFREFTDPTRRPTWAPKSVIEGAFLDGYRDGGILRRL